MREEEMFELLINHDCEIRTESLKGINSSGGIKFRDLQEVKETLIGFRRWGITPPFEEIRNKNTLERLTLKGGHAGHALRPLAKVVGLVLKQLGARHEFKRVTEGKRKKGGCRRHNY